MLGSGTTTLVFSNEDLTHIMKIKKPLKESGLLKKSVGKTIKNEAKEQKSGFLGLLLVPLGANLLINMLVGKGVMRADEDTVRASQNF